MVITKYMSSKRLIALLLALMFIVPISGCSKNTYQIIQASSAYKSTDYPDTIYDMSSAILLNTETGESWKLSPTEDNESGTEKWVNLKKE